MPEQSQAINLEDKSAKNALLMKESAKIALISQLLKAFDDKVEYNKNIELKEQEENRQYNANFKWTKGYKFVLLCILSIVVITVPIMFLTTVTSLPLYYGIVPLGIGAAYLYKRKFDKEQKPSLERSHKQTLEKIQQEKDENDYHMSEIINAIKAVTANVKTKEIILLYAYLPLDFMFSSLEEGYAKTIDDAVMFFDNHYDEIKAKTDEDSISLSNDIAKSLDEAQPRFTELKKRGLFANPDTQSNNISNTEKE